MAESSFLIPTTPASSSRAPSAISDDHSQQPDPSTRPIWVLFRLAIDNEPVWHTVKPKRGPELRKRLHYCLLCEGSDSPRVWSNAFTKSAKEHVYNKHPYDWRQWDQGNKAVASIPSHSSQKSLDDFVQPIHTL